MQNKINLKKYKPKKGHVLVLKSLPANLKAHGGFQWPESGTVTAPDWKPTKECGNGLHGWLWGQGDADMRCTDSDAVWMVLEVTESTIIDLDKKVKFKSCNIKFAGELSNAVAIVQFYAPTGTACIFGTATAGDGGTATAGDHGTATAGYRGTATAGDGGTATAGHGGTATAGDGGTATAGYGGTATAGYGGVIVIEYYTCGNFVKKCAMVDGVNIIAGQKYRIEGGEFKQVNDTV